MFSYNPAKFPSRDVFFLLFIRLNTHNWRLNITEGKYNRDFNWFNFEHKLKKATKEKVSTKIKLLLKQNLFCR